MNHSYRFYSGDATGAYTDSTVAILSDAVHFANRCHVSFVASRGNGSPPPPNGNGRRWDKLEYPACYDDDWVINVGGTGLDGQYKSINNGDPNYEPSIGGGIDLAAPSVSADIYTTNTGGGYDDYSGTSAAAPHVTGAVALLMSYLNDSVPSHNNLAPEDVEHILEVNAEDTDSLGYDALTGHGRLDVFRSLKYVEKPNRRIAHIDTDSFPSTTTTSLHVSNRRIRLTEVIENLNGVPFDNVEYIMDAYKVSSTVTHSSASTDSIIAAWVRPSSSTTFPLFDTTSATLIPHEKLSLVSVNTDSAELVGYVFALKDTLGNFIDWLPFDTTAAQSKMAYSLLLYHQLTSISDQKNELGTVELYPNPSSGGHTLTIIPQETGKLDITLYSIQGRLIWKKPDIQVQEGVSHTMTFDLSNLASGMYFYSIAMDTRSAFVKFVKQ